MYDLYFCGKILNPVNSAPSKHDLKTSIMLKKEGDHFSFKDDRQGLRQIVMIKERA